MNRETILQNWEQCSGFALFFSDFPRWLDSMAGTVGSNPANGLDQAQRDRYVQEYDELFKGVRADRHVPLWASACREGGRLWDARTLEVVKTYHAGGYEPVDLDGNPPDFIGQQFRFLCYLWASALRSLDRGESPLAYEQAAADFSSAFLGETARAAAAGIRSCGPSALFLETADRLEALVMATAEKEEACAAEAVRLSGKPAAAGKLPGKPLSAEPSPELACYAAWKDGPSPSLPDKPERCINTAGRNNCGGKCAVRAREQEGCLLAVSADCGLVGEPVMRACLRGRAYRETYMDSKRLRYPLQRIGERGEGRFRRISWEEAADSTAAQWKRIRDAYGPSSRYVNYSTGVSALIRPDMLAMRLLNLDGGHLSYYNSYSSACVRFTTPYIYGDNLSGNSIEDVLNTKLLILWGHNPKETIFGSERNYFIAKAHEQGIRIIVIDPRRSDSALAWADEWIGIRPSTDAALADAMAYVIWSEGLQDQDFMDRYCLGFDDAHLPPGVPPNRSYHALVFGKADGMERSPQWAAGITGIAAETITRLARDYAAAKPACLLPGLGIQRTGNGEQTVRTLAALTCLTGNVGKAGGGAAGSGGVRGPAFSGYPVPQNPYPGRIPSFLWTRALEHAAEMSPEADGLLGVKKLNTNIKMIINLAGNTLVNQHSDINNTIRLLKDTRACEFILCSDVFMTPSARFADILLPGPSFLEEENIAPPWDFGSYLLFNNKIIDPLFGCRSEYRFIEEIARRLGLWEAWSEGRAGTSAWLEDLYRGLRETAPELPEYAVFKQQGGYHFKEVQPHIAYAEQIRNGRPFATPSGKIEMYSPRLSALGRPHEVPAIPGYVPCPEGPGDPLTRRYPIQLIGWHTKRRTHSIHDNNPGLERVEPQRLWLHPKDGEARGIAEGDTVEVFNDRGRIRVPVRLTPRIIPGVAALAQGAWYTPDPWGIDTRGSINVLTSQRPTPLARGNPQHTNLVEIQKYEPGISTADTVSIKSFC